VEANGQIVPDGAPNGVFAVSVDEKGRLKLPAPMLAYLESFKDERKVFITTFDESEARIYPISVWRDTAKKLQEPGDDFEALDALARIADHYGKDVDVDVQGRLTLPDTLRKALNLEKDEVKMRCFQNRINVLGSAEYEKLFSEAKNSLAEKVKVLKRKAL
jgi:MraZ protein